MLTKVLEDGDEKMVLRCKKMVTKVLKDGERREAESCVHRVVRL